MTRTTQADAGYVPLVDISGDPYTCGRRLTQLCRERYPDETYYLDRAVADTQAMSPACRALFEARAPYLLEIWRAMLDAAGPSQASPPSSANEGCTSFGVHGSLTNDGAPISGQTKDNPLTYAGRYIVLRMRIAGGPTILVLAYPGELLGYGLWSTGMSLFRNDLKSSAGASAGLPFQQWGLLALACDSVQEAADLALAHGVAGAGNILLCDAHGDSLSVEFNVGGVSIVPSENGISIHANHPVGELTRPFEQYDPPVEHEQSRFRTTRLRALLEAKRGQLTPANALAVLADHEGHPRGLCRHMIGDRTDTGTTAAIVAEPAAGRLHVVKGHPCSNQAITHHL